MTDRSVADQELFLPQEGQASTQDQSQRKAPSQSRFYENLNNSAAPAPDHAQYGENHPQSGVPTFNVIAPTPSTSRSSTVRTNASHPAGQHTMTGALPEVTEEDNLYDAPSATPNYPSVPQQSSYQSDAPPPVPGYGPSYSSPEAPSQAAPPPPPPPNSSFPPATSASEPWADVPHQSTTYGTYPDPSQSAAAWASGPDSTTTHGESYPVAQSSEPWASSASAGVSSAPEPRPHPPTYEEYRESRKDEVPPPLPGPRPPIPSGGFQAEAQSSSAHPALHLDSDQDYALALQLQEEEDETPPPLPRRPARPAAPDVGPSTALSSHNMSVEEQDRALAMFLQEEEDSNAPNLPLRPGQSSNLGPPRPKAFDRTPSTDQFLPPPRREATDFGRDDPSDPIHYTRDPHKLTAYLIPFPTPSLTKAPSDAVPKRFLIYTPPPPPLQAPPEGVKEERTHKVQRKWQDEVRKAKLSEAKTTSWAGFRAKMTRGVSKAMVYTTTSNVDFLTRVTPATSPPRTPSPTHEQQKLDYDSMYDADPAHQSHETKRTVGLEQMIFVYSPSMNLTPDQMREEFVNTVLRTKSKAMRDSVIATGLLPISLAVDIILIAVSGLFEVNAAWAYFNIKGAKAARSVSKRLSSSTAGTGETVDPQKSESELQKEEKLKLDFKPATRIDVLGRYLAAECHRVDPQYFPEYQAPPTESDCLEAIGWSPHQTGGQKNWEDEAWELNEVKDDLRIVMHKAAKEWRSYCHTFEKNPEKNLNK